MIYYFYMYEWLQTGFGFSDYLQIRIPSNYSTLANSRIRLLTTAYTKSSQFVFTNRFLVTVPNNVLCLRPY
jgi:hypothetical protein